MGDVLLGQILRDGLFSALQHQVAQVVGTERAQANLRGFQIKPAECEQRLRQVVVYGGNAETFEQAYDIWKGLVQDLQRLIDDAETKP